MAKRTFELDDETLRMLKYYLAHSQIEEDELINRLIKSFLTEHLSSKQIQLARQHKGKDSFPTDEILRNFGDMWKQD
ncbi:hypothetical protein J2Z60_002127 [Lactobacillus colini]|uniref:CopG family transcriptional regulator n=1 Tax=Lactobacillus colini TaxID=1819254 RepID=A0ABS4MHW5_9LACO|nr:hypothetical protein [Lactobacillus colini]MBP2058936.1 hypothetical protein [Lactobacillus colini]